MALSPAEYTTRLAEVGSALSRLRGDLYDVIDEEEETTAEQRDAVLAAARQRLGEYDAFIAELEGNQKAEAARTLENNVSTVRKYVAQIEQQGGGVT
jgi:hypothetical protein